jgi:putative heme iron utilization protein
LPQHSGAVHLPGQGSRLDIYDVTGARHTLTLSRLRDEPSADLTLRNLMDALTLVYELRARYRVFEFEAAQEGAEACAELFAALSEAEGQQIKALMHGLRERLEAAEHAAGEPA